MERRGKKWGFAAAIAVVIASLGVFAAMAMLTLPSSDDFWYMSFLNDGIRRYLSLMKEHYLTFNGRVLVHVVDHIVLHFGNWCFAIVGAALLCSIPVLLNAASGRGRGHIPWAMALFLPAVFSMPRTMLNQGILWISAFFNYVLPTAMLTCQVLLYELLQKRQAKGGALLGAAFVIWSGLCGATTEQAGFSALLLTAYFLIKALILKRDRLTSSLALLCSAAGLLSIFASPATRTRLGYGAKLGDLAETVSAMYANMGPCAGELCSTWLVPVALTVLFVLAGVAVYRKTGKKWPLGVFCVPAAASLVAIFCPQGVRTALFVALCFAAAAAAGALMASGEEAAGTLVMAGLASFAVILVTDSFGGRTLVPFLLTLVAADAVLLSSYIRDLRGALGGIAPAALLALGLAAAIPFIGGMLKNYAVEQENRENLRAARETGEFRYCLDYDLNYTSYKLQWEFMEEYLAGERLPEDTKVTYYSRLRPALEANGETFYPTYIDEDGQVMIWIRVVEAFGGRTVMHNGYAHLTAELPWTACDIEADEDDPETALFTWEGGSAVYSRGLAESRTWFPLEAYTESLGFDVRYDEERDTYVISAPQK